MVAPDGRVRSGASERYAQFYFEQSPSPSLAWTIGIYAQLISALGLAVLSLREHPDSTRRRLEFGLKAIGVIAGSCVCLRLVAFFTVKMTGWGPLIYVVNAAFVVMPLIAVVWLMPVNASFFSVAANPRVWRETKAGPNRWAHSILFGSIAALVPGGAMALAGQLAHRGVESCASEFSCAFAMGGWVTMAPALALLCGLTAALIAWRHRRQLTPEPHKAAC